MNAQVEQYPAGGAAPPHALLYGGIVSRELPRAAWDAAHAAGSDSDATPEPGEIEPFSTKEKTCKNTRSPCCRPTVAPAKTCGRRCGHEGDEPGEEGGAGLRAGTYLL